MTWLYRIAAAWLLIIAVGTFLVIWCLFCLLVAVLLFGLFAL